MFTRVFSCRMSNERCVARGPMASRPCNIFQFIKSIQNAVMEIILRRQDYEWQLGTTTARVATNDYYHNFLSTLNIRYLLSICHLSEFNDTLVTTRPSNTIRALSSYFSIHRTIYIRLPFHFRLNKHKLLLIRTITSF